MAEIFRWHAIPLSGDVVHVAARQPDSVELWAVNSDGPATHRRFRVVGTGWPIPDGVRHVGTAIVPGGILVWHLIETPQPAEETTRG
jgi:hypothetical protein